MAKKIPNLTKLIIKIIKSNNKSTNSNFKLRN